jgi:hypothetical protein
MDSARMIPSHVFPCLSAMKKNFFMMIPHLRRGKNAMHVPKKENEAIRLFS